jgi:hypothetical protein
MAGISVSKANVYAVLAPLPGITVSKANVYAVLQSSPMTLVPGPAAISLVTRAVTWTITAPAPPDLAADCNNPPDGVVGVPYSHTFLATGGIPPYDWVALGSLPPGLSFSSSGVLSGTPTADNDPWLVSVAVIDNNGDGPGTQYLDCSITIAPPDSSPPPDGDMLGPIVVPTPPTIGKFPIQPDYGSGTDYQPPIIVHTFGQAGLKTEQRFLTAPAGPRRFRFSKNHLACTEYNALRAHWEQAQGCYAQFPLDVWEPGGKATYTVRYENPTLGFDYMVALLTQGPGVTFIEQVDAPVVYTSRSPRLSRFPDASLTAALTSQFQQIIPLVTIETRDGTMLRLSNQRCQIDGDLYLPRMLDWSGISQSLGENSDAGSFNFGNSDGVWTQLVNQVNLYAASVQLTLYHVQDRSLLDLWAGYLTNWQLDTSGKFQVNVADGAFLLTLPYPSRKILRTCWKVYKGRWCPSTSSFPDCPKDYDSCVARGVPHSFGGMVFPPQAVHIKDNSTGVWGFGRSAMTSVSVVQDTVYQRPLQEIFTDGQMLVTADVAEGRDENTFYAALGIVGEGPISSFAGGPDGSLILHKLDGQPPHDPLNFGGFRAFTGTDPSGSHDFVGISQAGPDGKWNGSDGQIYIPPDSTFAAGIAMAEIRRTDEKGLQLSPISDRSMQIAVVGGLGGWVWTAPGARTWLNALHNCIWVALNVYLRAIGLRVDPTNQGAVSPEEMEQHFDVEQCIEMASICDTDVPVLIGSGTEMQFPFRGILKEQKPVRDWLREILNCCGASLVFSNGKFFPIIRVNSSVLNQNGFTEATILFRSLVMSPLQPSFNWLTGEFGDQAFGFQLNNCTVYDIDHASTLGTVESPQYLMQNINYVGVSNLSQCARLISTRLREEIGGLKSGSGPHGTDSAVDEQMIARNFQFRTTVLALGTQVGDIVGLEHPAFPYKITTTYGVTGYAEGRVSRWAINPDFSIDIQASCTTEDMYDLVVGPKPTDVMPPPAPPERLQSPTGLAWMPNEIGPSAGDPVYAAWERTFALWQQYEITTDGVWQPSIWVRGKMTVNNFAGQTQPRILDIEFTAGGILAGPQTVYVALTQHDANQSPTAPSNLTAVYIPNGLVAQKIVLTVAPASDPGSVLTGWDLWAGTDRRRIAKQTQTGGSGAPPTTLSFAGPIEYWTEGLPEAAATGVKIQAKHVHHAGIAGLLVTDVTAPNQITCLDLLDSTDNWIGQLLFVCSNVYGEVPVWNFQVIGFNASTGTLTVSPYCASAGDTTNSVQPGDVLIVYSQATAADAHSITNTMWDNSVNRQQFPESAGMKPGAEVGKIVRILRGTGAGQWRYISANDQYTHTVTPAWDVTPDTTSLYIVEDPEWLDPSETSKLDAPTPDVAIEMHTLAPNLTDEVVLVGGWLIDRDGRQTDDAFVCYRMIYVFGQPPTVRLVGPEGGPYDLEITDQVIRVDTSTNDVTINLLPLADYQGRDVLIFNSGPNTTILNTSPPDTFPDGTTQLSITTAGGTARLTAGGIYST